MYIFETFRLDVKERRLLNGERLVPLRRQAFDLLVVLVEAGGRLMTRDELIEAIWPNAVVVEHNLTTVVSELRRVLGDEDKNPRIIETVRGCGYRVITPVQHSGEYTNSPAQETKISKELDELKITSLGRIVGSEESSSSTAFDGRNYQVLSKRRAAFTLLSVLIFASTILLGWHYSRFTQSSSWPRSGSKSKSPPKSIAVLPFFAIGRPITNNYFGVGLQEMLLTKLADIPNLKVIAQSSTHDYASHPTDLAAIARQLGVRSVLEGSVQETANRVRVNVQLLSPFTHTTIWASSYTRTLRNIFQLQSTIASSIATALKLHLLKSTSQRIKSPPTQNAVAYNFFLRAEYEFELSTRTGSTNALEQSIHYYHQAIKKDSEFALAYARLSKALMSSYIYGYNRNSAVLVQANAAANKALEIEPDLADAHTAKGIWYYSGRHSIPEARKEFKEALSLKPQDASVLLVLGEINRHQGDWRNGLSEISLAVTLNPMSMLALRNLSMTEAALRNYSKAISLENRAVSINPEDAIDFALLATYYLDNGQLNQALETLRTVPKDTKKNSYVNVVYLQALMMNHEFAKAGDEANHLYPGGQLKLWNILDRRAEAYWYDGHYKKALRDYAEVAQMLRQAIKKQPQNAKMHAFLGIAYAHLGNSMSAISEGQRAVSLLPLKKYPLIGPAPLENLAEIYALTGESKKAIAILHRLMSVPAGDALSVALLKFDPVWSTIHNAPGFIELLKTNPTTIH